MVVMVKKVTIVVHSDVKKILTTIKDKLYEYSKSVRNLNLKITTSPIVLLEKAGDNFVTGDISCKSATAIKQRQQKKDQDLCR